MENELINLMGIQKKAVLARFRSTVVEMSELTDEEEIKIEKNKDAILGVTIKLKNGCSFNCKNIILYGDIDFKSKADLRYIKSKKTRLINLDSDQNILKSNFDYELGGYRKLYKPATKSTHEEYVDGWYPTYNVIKWLKYNHCLIGKPKKIVIYEC